MSDFVPKPNSGALYRVPAEKRTKDTWPEYEGEFSIFCPNCEHEQKGWISAWIKEVKATGGKFFSLAFKHRTGGPKI